MFPEGSRLQGPIFIAGAPRSGTTLLRNLLNRHPQIGMCRETGFFHYVYSRRREFGDLRDAGKRRRLVDEYLSIQRIQRMRVDMEALRARLLREGTSYQSLFTALLRFPAEAAGKALYGEKTPHTLFLETLWEWYPEAKVIHLLRDPRDVVASLQRMPWAANSVVTNARIWLSDNLRAWGYRAQPGYLLVRYEDLVAEPERELRRVCGAIGVDYARCMMIPRLDPTADRPWFHRAEEPVTPGRSGAWREALTAGDAALIEWVAGRHMDVLGYAASQPAARWPVIARGLGWAAWDSARRWIGEFPGGWLYVTKSKKLAAEEAAKDRFRFRHLTERLGS